MGQLFRRVVRIADSYLNDKASSLKDNPFYDKEEELKRIIDELNSYQKETQSRQKENRKNKSNTSEAHFDSEQMNEARACKVLMIPQGASIDEIKSAYKKRMMEYHPDRVAGLGEEIRELARTKSVEINSAYNYMKNIKRF